MIISVLNHKGGVGKTTTVHNLGAALASMGKRVIMVDFDPQCNLTFHCSAKKQLNGIGSAMLNNNSVQPLNISDNLDLMPGNEYLDEIALTWGHKPEQHTNHVKGFIKTFKDKYDFILIDTAPGSSMLMVNSIFAADSLIIPICDIDSMHGASKIAQLVNRHKIHVSGHYLISRHDERMIISRQMYAAMTQQNKDAVFKTRIRSTEVIRQAAARCTDVISYAPKSRAAYDFTNLAQEIIQIYPAN